jgi:hypothetical protein
MLVEKSTREEEVHSVLSDGFNLNKKREDGIE